MRCSEGVAAAAADDGGVRGGPPEGHRACERPGVAARRRWGGAGRGGGDKVAGSRVVLRSQVATDPSRLRPCASPGDGRAMRR
jgi:hypothetical protein